jgi:hypothetical protein
MNQKLVLLAAVVVILFGAVLLFTGFNPDAKKVSSTTLADDSSSAEARFLVAVNALKASRETLVAAIDSDNFTQVSAAVLVYNRTAYNVRTVLLSGCADSKIKTKHADICIDPVLLNECNIKDAQITYLMMKLDYLSETMSSDECYTMVDLLRNQEKCTVVGEGYTASDEVITEIESICSGL